MKRIDAMKTNQHSRCCGCDSCVASRVEYFAELHELGVLERVVRALAAVAEATDAEYTRALTSGLIPTHIPNA